MLAYAQKDPTVIFISMIHISWGIIITIYYKIMNEANHHGLPTSLSTGVLSSQFGELCTQFQEKPALASIGKLNSLVAEFDKVRT